MRSLHEAQKVANIKPSCYNEGRYGGFWSAALTDCEVKALYDGRLACRVKPDTFQPGDKCPASPLNTIWIETIMTPEERAKEITSYWLGLRKFELPMAEADIARHIRAAVKQSRSH